MKRLISVILVIILLFCFCGCETGKDYRVPVNFYYCTDPIGYDSVNAVISPEIREGDGYTDDLQAVLEHYLLGPSSDGFRSPVPAGVHVENISTDSGIITVTLSGEFAQLTDHTLTLACTCISMTLLELGDNDTVRIQAAGALLGGSEYIEICRENLLFLDEYTPETE